MNYVSRNPNSANVAGICHVQLDAEKVAINPRFEKYLLKLPAVERLTTGLRWAKLWSGSASFTSSFVYSRRTVLLFVFLATSVSPEGERPSNTSNVLFPSRF